MVLAQNVPNPFNPYTRIAFRLDAGGGTHVRLGVYDTRGRLVRALMQEQEHLPSGTYHVAWDGTDQQGGRVQSGIYARLEAGGQQATRKIMLLQ